MLREIDFLLKICDRFLVCLVCGVKLLEITNTLLSSKTQKKIEGVGDLQPLCTYWLPWKTQHIHGTMCFTNNVKNKLFPFESRLDMRKLRHSCNDLICREEYVGQSINKLCTRCSSHRSTVQRMLYLDLLNFSPGTNSTNFDSAFRY